MQLRVPLHDLTGRTRWPARLGLICIHTPVAGQLRRRTSDKGRVARCQQLSAYAWRGMASIHISMPPSSMLPSRHPLPVAFAIDTRLGASPNNHFLAYPTHASHTQGTQDVEHPHVSASTQPHFASSIAFTIS